MTSKRLSSLNRKNDILKLLEDKTLSQKDIAERMKVSREYVSELSVRKYGPGKRPTSEERSVLVSDRMKKYWERRKAQEAKDAASVERNMRSI